MRPWEPDSRRVPHPCGFCKGGAFEFPGHDPKVPGSPNRLPAPGSLRVSDFRGSGVSSRQACSGACGFLTLKLQGLKPTSSGPKWPG
jgi:hypothetical protein